jgi:hypothetical protein
MNAANEAENVEIVLAARVVDLETAMTAPAGTALVGDDHNGIAASTAAEGRATAGTSALIAPPLPRCLRLI